MTHYSEKMADDNNAVSKPLITKGLDGCPLFINLQGEDPDTPLILFLHGGPGGCLNPPVFRALIGRELEKKYQVAYWFQRMVIEPHEIPYESIKTKWPSNTSDYEYSIQAHVDDLRCVIELLLEETGRDSLILLGHSWGGHIGFRYLYQHRKETLVSHWVAVAPSINPVENARISYAYLLKESKRRGMDDIVEFLEERGCPPWDSISDILYMMRCSELVFGAFADIPEELITERTEFESVPSQEWVKRRLALSSRIWNELKSADITGLLPHIQTPMLMALGEVDYFVPPMAVEIGFDIYGGYKEKVLFPGTKHLVYRGCEAPFLDRVTRFLDQPFESPNRIQRSA